MYEDGFNDGLNNNDFMCLDMDQTTDDEFKAYCRGYRAGIRTQTDPFRITHAYPVVTHTH